MNIVIIGSGNVATVLGGKLVMAGNRIIQVISRQAAHAARLAGELDSTWSAGIAQLNPEADLYLLTVSDQALYQLSMELVLPGRLVLHTAGAVSKQVLLPVSRNSGVFYPLQSLRKEIRPYPEFPLLIDANDPEDIPVISGLAGTISGQVRLADDDTRLKLHLSAVLLNNFSNHLYTLTEDFCQHENVDFSLLLPIIRETASRISAGYHPEEVQTGPAIRGDDQTIEKHLNLLNKYLNLKELYRLFTNQVKQYYAGKK